VPTAPLNGGHGASVPTLRKLLTAARYPITTGFILDY
jgi:hypothetical protein